MGALFDRRINFSFLFDQCDKINILSCDSLIVNNLNITFITK